MSLADVIREKEAELRLIKDHEIVVVFDLSGAIILEVHGGASSVDISPYLDQIRRIDSATLTHNHPLGWRFPAVDPRHAGNSFSLEDVVTACDAETRELRAVGPKCAYSMQPPAGLKWNREYWINAVRPSFEKHKAAFVRSTLLFWGLMPRSLLRWELPVASALLSCYRRA